MRYLALLSLLALGCTEDYDVPNHVPGIVKVIDGKVYTTYGEGGLIISDDASQTTLVQIFPPQGMNSIDDVAIDGDLIFVLDTRGRDYFAVYSLGNNPPDLVAAPVSVEGGPFNGIAAANGNLVISGGTFFLERFRYSENGDITGSISFGRDRGHPDVQLSDDGKYAFVSTDFSLEANPRFGVLSLQLNDELSIPTVVSELGIEDSGFSEGVTTPTGFPIQSAQLNNYLLVAHGNGLSIIQMTHGVFGANEILNIGINSTAISTYDNAAYIVGLDNGDPTLVVVDLTDFNNPSIFSTEKLIASQIPTSIAVGANYVYVACGNDGVVKVLKD